MVRAAFFASLLIAVEADDPTVGEASALLQSRFKTKGLDDDDTGSCAGKSEYCFDATSMSGKCLREQPLWNFPWGYWNCNRAAKYCNHNLWKYDVVRCCPGVCTTEELYNAEAPVFNNGGIGGCEASNATCQDCAGTSTWCLQSRDHWTPNHNCENSKKWCADSKWGKDMLECCPGVCNTAADADGACQLTGCSALDAPCTDCDDNSDLCLRKESGKKHMTCEKARDVKGWCNSDKHREHMLTCCPGMCEAQPNNADGGQCARLGCQASEETCTDCEQNSDKCLAKRRGKKWTCPKAKKKGMCTRNYKKKHGRTWMDDMRECCPKECGAVPSTENGQQICAYTGCKASDQHCDDCNDHSDSCMQKYKNSYKWTCENARDHGYCSIRDGWNWEKRKEAMNNCCPGVCKGEWPADEMIPEWAVCRGGSGTDEEIGLDPSSVTPEEPAAGGMD